MIKNIIFDLSEVIISGYHGVENIIEQNTNISPQQFLERKKQTLDIFLDTMKGKYSENEYVDYLLNGTNWNITREELKQIIRMNLNIPIEGTMNIIKRLKNNYNIILLSDHVKEWMEYIFNNNVELDIIDHKYFSYEYGKLKSDEGCFKYIVEDLNINPNETLFIDDYKENVKSANKNGIEGIVFEDSKQLEKELMKRKIL